jgi:hypothetical protein
MPLTQSEFDESLNALFDPTIDWGNPLQLAESAAAYQNLAMHFIETNAGWLFDRVAFDPVKMGLMLKRFYRDAFGVGRFLNQLPESEFSDAQIKKIEEMLSKLSIRINSDDPRKIRIAAAFSLWACTMRPICVLQLPTNPDSRIWRLEATINFWIATQYLKIYGNIQIGVPGDLDDFDTRLRRVWYDFTVRDINLSSLEMMYSSIFRPYPKDTSDKKSAVTS